MLILLLKVIPYFLVIRRISLTSAYSLLRRFSILGPLLGVKGQSDLFNPYPKHARAHDNAISRRQASPSSLLARAKKRGGASSPDKQLQNACESHVVFPGFCANYKDEQAAKLKLVQIKESPKPDA